MKRVLVASLACVGVLVSTSAGVRADEAASEAPAERHGSAFVDPLGFVMFGARLGVEAGSGHVTGALTARWFDGALLSRSLFLRSGDDFGFSWGAGLRGRYYFDDGQGGAHLGAGAEYLRTRIETKSALIAAISSYAIPYAEGGYRLVRGRFYGDAAAALGYAARLGGHVENLPGGTGAATYQVENKSSVYGALGLELGIFF
jgi:hypothetical protein